MIWQRIVNYAAKLASRAMARRWPWLLVAPLVAIFYEALTIPIARLGMGGGIILGFVTAAALSLVLFVGRGIIEQRRMAVDDLVHGLGAFMGDTMNVLFVFWIASLLGRVFPPITWAVGAALVLMPVFEAVALTPVSGYGAFGSAWSFFQRNAGPWLFGQWPILVIWGAWVVVGHPALDVGLSTALGGRPLLMARLLADQSGNAILFAGFIYRGILFLALDSVAPHARAAKFGRA